MTFDPTKKRAKPKAPKQEKKQKDLDDQLYNVTRYNKLIVYESKEDAYKVLRELKLTSSNPQGQAQRLTQTFNWPKYKNAAMDEVNKLWSFDRVVQDNKKEDLSKYTYEDMLTNIFDDFSQKQRSQKQFEIPALQIERPRPKQFNIKNFKEVCQALNRTDTHVCEFLKKQLNARICHVQDGELIFQAMTTEDKLKGYLQEYAQQFIKCPSCGSYDTVVISQENGRDQLLQCESCNSQRHIKKHSDD